MKARLQSGLAVGSLVLLAFACGKKKSAGDETDTSAPGVSGKVGDSVSLSGQLNLAAANLGFNADSTQRQILYFMLVGGEVFDAPTKVVVDANGKFTASVSAVNKKLVSIKAALEQSPIDKAALKEALPEHAADIDAAPDAELKSALQDLVDKMDAAGGPQYLLVSYVPSGDALEEAKSFQFIGLPSSGQNVMVFPADGLKGNLNLGKISGSGDNATAELKANSSVFAMDDNAIVQLASIGQTLKVVKNYWVNKDENGKVAVEAEPFFAWQAKLSDIVDGGSAAAAPVYSGYGLYVKVNGFTSVNFDALCPTGPNGTPTQKLTLAPPADVSWATSNWQGTLNPATVLNEASPFNNEQTSRQSQNGKSVCMGNATGFYGRDDGNGSYMFNWGTGGSLQSAVPAGFWDFKLDGTSKGKFDVSSGYPVDADGKAKVYVPRVSITKSGENVSGIDVKFAVYNAATKTYDDVSDVALFKKMAADISISVSISNGNGADEHRGVMGRSDSENEVNMVWDGAVVKGSIDAAYQKAIASDWNSSNGKITSIAVSYVIGTSNYRFEYRP